MKPEIYSLLDSMEDSEEHFVDAPDEDDKDQQKKQENVNVNKSVYDPYKREPKYSGAEMTCLWEIVR